MLSGKQVKAIWEASEASRRAMATRAAYFEGRQTIGELGLPRIDGKEKSKVFTNWTRYVVKFHAGFLSRDPATYSADRDQAAGVEELRRLYRAKSLAAQDRRLLSDAILYGGGVEVVSFDGAELSFTRTPRAEWAILRDAEDRIRCAIRRVEVPAWSYLDGELLEEKAEVWWLYDAAQVVRYAPDKDGALVPKVVEVHPYGRPPVVEFCATEDRASFLSNGFLVQSDVYDVTRSSLTDDIKHNVDSLLMLKGVRFEPLLEKDKRGRTVLEKLKAVGVLPIPENGDANYISRAVDVEKFRFDLQVTRASLHLMGCVPDLDEAIAGNQGTVTSISGIALKLLFQNALQQSGEFEDNFTRGQRERVALVNAINSALGRPTLEDFEVRLSRALPFNDIELVQFIPNLRDVVSRRELLRLLPFISDVEAVIREMDEEATTAPPPEPSPAEGLRPLGRPS